MAVNRRACEDSHRAPEASMHQASNPHIDGRKGSSSLSSTLHANYRRDNCLHYNFPYAPTLRPAPRKACSLPASV